MTSEQLVLAVDHLMQQVHTHLTAVHDQVNGGYEEDTHKHIRRATAQQKTHTYVDRLGDELKETLLNEILKIPKKKA